MEQKGRNNWGHYLIWPGLLLVISILFTMTLWLTRVGISIKPANCQELAACGGQAQLKSLGYPRLANPEGETADYELGLAAVNLATHRYLGGFRAFFYQASESLGVIVIVIAVAYVALGDYSLLKVKSLRKVPREFYYLAGLYLITAIIYLVCEHVSINCRPVLLEEGLEASFPSSHTLLASVVLGAAVILNNYWYRAKESEHLKIFKRAKVVCFLNILCSLLLVLTVFGRLLAGVHWLTDIIGGLLIAATLLAFFRVLLYRSSRQLA